MSYTALPEKTDLHNQTLVVQPQKYPNTFLLVFFVSPQIVKTIIALTHFFQHVSHVENTFKYINTYAYICLLFVCTKGKIVLLLDKTSYVSQKNETNVHWQPKFYFHFHNKLLCIKAVHLSDKLSLTCPRVWPVEDICIGLCVLKRPLNVWHILEKVVSMQHCFEEFSE